MQRRSRFGDMNNFFETYKWELIGAVVLIVFVYLFLHKSAFGSTSHNVNLMVGNEYLSYQGTLVHNPVVWTVNGTPGGKMSFKTVNEYLNPGAENKVNYLKTPFMFDTHVVVGKLVISHNVGTETLYLVSTDKGFEFKNTLSDPTSKEKGIAHVDNEISGFTIKNV